MVTGIYIISGFLGAGKTTFIQKLLSEVFINDKVVIIENDFGESSVDAALLQGDGITVHELNSGCICCSLKGDFIKALKEIKERFQPDKIIIEPSGVGKLSDILQACNSLNEILKVYSKITIVDVKHCKMYLENFGQFYEDQIQKADVVFLSRTQDYPEKTQEVFNLVTQINPNAFIFIEPWNQITNKELVLATNGQEILHKEAYTDEHSCQEYNHEACGCEHHHDAKAVFDTVTLRSEQVFKKDDLEMLIAKMIKLPKTEIIRAKGIVQGENGYLNLQYSPDNLTIDNTSAEGNFMCIIGTNLNKSILNKLFCGE